MTSVGWLDEPSEEALQSALAIGAPELAGLPLRMHSRPRGANPLYWSSSAVVAESFVVKFAWSQVRAVRLWREGVILARLKTMDPLLPIPDLVALNMRPALVVTRLVTGEPLGDLQAGPSPCDAQRTARQLGTFLVGLHGMNAADVVGGLPVVEPTPQADSQRLRLGFPRLVDGERSARVLRWCDWVDGVLRDEAARPEVFVHGDLHGHNQVWDSAQGSLAAVVDFDESGAFDAHFDFRYLPGIGRNLDVLLATMHAYAELSRVRLDLARVMAWHVLTVLGDALWRTEANIGLPGGGDATSYVDDLDSRLGTLELG